MLKLIKEFKLQGIAESEIIESYDRLFKNDIDLLINDVRRGKPLNVDQEIAILSFKRMQFAELVRSVYAEKRVS